MLPILPASSVPPRRHTRHSGMSTWSAQCRCRRRKRHRLSFPRNMAMGDRREPYGSPARHPNFLPHIRSHGEGGHIVNTASIGMTFERHIKLRASHCPTIKVNSNKEKNWVDLAEGTDVLQTWCPIVGPISFWQVPDNMVYGKSERAPSAEVTPCPSGLSSCNPQREFLLMLKALAPGDVVTVTRIDRPRKHDQRRVLPFLSQCRRGRRQAQLDADQNRGRRR
jgi:hypothetical protein